MNPKPTDEPGTRFKMVCESTAKELEQSVNNCMSAGFILHGSPLWNGQYVMQAMTYTPQVKTFSEDDFSDSARL